MTTAGPAPRGAGASIGAVLGRLRAEFPDVTISKIRFLESEGLIRPGRTSSGYRQFSPADVERLRYILAAQRDHYLPLKVIKEHLDESDRGGTVRRGPRPLVGLDPDPAVGDGSAVSDQKRLSRDELLERVGISSAALSELESYGVLRPGPAGFYAPETVDLARTAATLTAFGLEPRHLRALRAAADREVGLLAQLVAPVRRKHDPDARARADEMVRELAGLSVRLHDLLVQTGLRDAADA